MATKDYSVTKEGIDMVFTAHETRLFIKWGRFHNGLRGTVPPRTFADGTVIPEQRAREIKKLALRVARQNY
jgi:hypothetical protein